MLCVRSVNKLTWSSIIITKKMHNFKLNDINNLYATIPIFNENHTG